MDLIIFTGLQASGKSTFYRTYFAATHDYVSKDILRNNKNHNKRQFQLIESALRTQHSVVVDNTNPTIEVRKPLIDLGQYYGATIISYYFIPDLSQSLKRNRQRTGKAKVPDVALYTTHKKLEAPSYAEGFDKLYNVQITNNSSFEVREWIRGRRKYTYSATITAFNAFPGFATKRNA
jgi:predicted kinase